MNIGPQGGIRLPHTSIGLLAYADDIVMNYDGINARRIKVIIQ